MENTKLPLLKFEKCNKNGHNERPLEFICTLNSCEERFHCSNCLLKDHSHHFVYMLLIEQYLNEKKQPLNIKTISMPNSLKKEINDLISNVEIEVSNYTKTLENEGEIIKKELNSIGEIFENEINKTFNEIDNNKLKSIENLNLILSSMEEEKQKFETMNQKIEISNLREYESYLNSKYKNSKIISNENNLQIIHNKFSSIINHNNKVNNYTFDTINEKINSIIKLNNIDIKLFAFHLMKTYIPSSDSDIKTLKNTRIIETTHKKSIYKIIFIDNESKFVTASDDSVICIWDNSNGALLSSLLGHTDRIWNIIKFGDEKLISASSDQKIISWNLKTYTRERIFNGHLNYVCALMEMPNQILLSGSHDKTMRLWNVEDGSCTRTIKPEGQGRIMIVIMYNSNELITGSENNINLIDFNNGKITKSLKGHTHLIRDLLLLDDFNTLLSASDDKTLRMWKIDSGQLLKTYSGHSHSTNKILNFKKGVVCTASDDATIKFWDIEKYKTLHQPLHNLTGHTSWVIFATITNNGTLVSCGADKKIRFWNNN